MAKLVYSSITSLDGYISLCRSFLKLYFSGTTVG